MFPQWQVPSSRERIAGLLPVAPEYQPQLATLVKAPPQGDGWLRSFDALTGKLFWKFDINFKTSHLELGGRGTRNDILATPVYYDGRVYVAWIHEGRLVLQEQKAASYTSIAPRATAPVLAGPLAAWEQDGKVMVLRLDALESSR